MQVNLSKLLFLCVFWVFGKAFIWSVTTYWDFHPLGYEEHLRVSQTWNLRYQIWFHFKAYVLKRLTKKFWHNINIMIVIITMCKWWNSKQETLKLIRIQVEKHCKCYVYAAGIRILLKKQSWKLMFEALSKLKMLIYEKEMWFLLKIELFLWEQKCMVCILLPFFYFSAYDLLWDDYEIVSENEFGKWTQ